MSVYKKGNKWYCRFQIKGERHHFLCPGATSAKEAAMLEHQFIYKAQQQINGVLSKEKQAIKFKTLYELYANYSKLNKKSYVKDISFIKILRSYFNDNDIASDKTPKDFEKFKSFMRTYRNASDATINKYLSILSKMYNLCINEHIIASNPLQNVKKLQEKNYIIRYLLLDEECRLYKAIRELRPYLEPIITCALQTAMRKSEILLLKWKNINFDYMFINIVESKSGKARKVPISKTLLKTLNLLPRISEYVFINPDTGTHYTDIKHSWSTICRAANIKNFRFHDLRHTAITRMVEKGIPLPVVQDIAGHSKIETTMRYTHVIPEQKIQAIEVLSSYNKKVDM